MKVLFTIVAILAVFGFSSFGPGVMAHESGHSESCPAAFMTGSTCQTLQGFLGHLSSIATAMQAVTQHAGVQTLALLLLLVGVSVLFTKPELSTESVSLIRVRRERSVSVTLSLLSVFRWSSLLEHSPTLP